MSLKEPKEFEISKLLELTDKAKYAVTVAAFEAIDKLDQIDLPKKYNNRKASIRAMIALSEGLITYDYIDDTQREALDEELRSSRKGRYALDAMFSTAPMADESEEDLDEDIMTEPTEEFEEPVMDDEDMDSDDSSETGSSARKKAEDDDEDDDLDDVEEEIDEIEDDSDDDFEEDIEEDDEK
jgi:hypothetical protein